ncbi:THO complex, subunit THOC1 [Sphaerosporella brunnea]|uniref:THO complex, subunit THOC1 n=1 Tax=Sphaerosporella brunnea TaxID=1250544 RepID=A0A5J5F4F3_9PEZI|nr:THO complex, subunit THOC1 [Sphaerosporella brunnea]
MDAADSIAPAAAPAETKMMPDCLEANLKDLLQAIQKPTLDPPLTVSDLKPEKLERIKPATADDFYKTSLETAHKTILYDIAVRHDPDDRAADVAFAHLLDLALIFSEMEIADNGLPFTLLEEMFDTMTIPQCERIFCYLESRIERLTTGMEGGKGKALVLLRFCNELLRRLSKAEDTIFCGRILIFLSKSFPIAERSAVNLRGDFNVDNVTIFDEMPEPEPDVMELDGVEPASEAEKEGAAAKVKSVPVQPPMSTDQLYTTFWSMQHDFADPTRLFKPENFERFKKALGATMAKFKEADEEALQSTGGATKNDAGGPAKSAEEKRATAAVAGEKRKRLDDDNGDDLRGGFNPKYLTSRELFELELGSSAQLYSTSIAVRLQTRGLGSWISDLTFRRNVLVQAMVLLDFLLSLTSASKEKISGFTHVNRGVQYNFTLSPEDEAWAMKTKDQISLSLQPNTIGRLFMRLINTVLTREQNWVQWKVEGCHGFDLAPLPSSEFQDAKSKAVNHCKAERPFPYVMGTPTLNRLWQDTGKHLQIDDLEDEDRRRVPSIDSFRDGVDKDLEDLKDAMLPADIEEGQNAIQTKTWKALRLAAQTKFHLFNRFDDRFDESRNDLQMLVDVEAKANEEQKARQAQAPKSSA